jgi:RNA polymerase sigma factor (sigma-70 family)
VDAGTGGEVADGELVARALAGDPDAYGRLYLRWFQPVYEVARRVVHNPDSAAEVAQEVFLNGWRSLPQLRDPAAVGGWLLCSARHRALNLVERERRSVSVDLEAPPDPARPTTGVPWERLAVATDPTDALADAEVAALVWESAEALGPRDQSLLDLHLRHGLTPAQIAEQLAVEPNAAHQMLHRLRRRLKAAVEARVLWRDGTPACTELADLVTASGITTFDAATVRLVDEHAEGCAECTQRRRTRLAPAVLFSSAAAAAAPISVVTRVAEALAAEGVPMGRVPHDLRRRARGRSVRNHRVAALAVAAVTILGVMVLGWGTVTEPHGTETVEGSGVDGASLGDPVQEPGGAETEPEGATTTTLAGPGDPVGQVAGGSGDATYGGSSTTVAVTAVPAGSGSASGGAGSGQGVVDGGSGDASGGAVGGSSGADTTTTTTTVAQAAPPAPEPDAPSVTYVEVTPKTCGKDGNVLVVVTYSAPAGVSGWSGAWSSSGGASGGSVGIVDGWGGFTLTQDSTGLKLYVDVTVTDSLGRSASGSGAGYC